METRRIEVLRWDTGAVIHAGEFASVKELVEDGVQRGISFFRAHLEGAWLEGAWLEGAHLDGARLDGASLESAWLDGARLKGALLEGAHLEGAWLEGAHLDGARLDGAHLDGARLEGAWLNFNSHALLSEILYRAAGDNIEKQMLAALIGRKVEWCWKNWMAFEHPAREWALDELAKWVKDGDNAPEVLRARTRGA